jgi:hypothetical protein
MMEMQVAPREAPVTEVEITELPLREVPDWDAQVRRAAGACRLIDRHLEYEARGRYLTDALAFRPEHLCPEQRVQMLTDLHGAVA